MTRDRATTILKRILETIDAGKVPVRIQEVWVFGSYAQGALAPGDVDLIIVHEKMSETVKADLADEAKRKRVRWPDELYYPERRYRSMITSPLRRPGESVDLVLGTSLEDVLLYYSPVRNGRRVLLWSESMRKWQVAIESIKPDSSAKRAERKELIPAKRAGCSLDDMRWLTTIIEEKAIEVARIEPAEWPVPLSDECQRKADLWISHSSVGTKSCECLPLGLWWMERCGVTSPNLWTRELHDESYAFRVSFGRLHPREIVWFLRRPTAMAAAHVMHFKRGEPKLLLDFRRGTAWERMDEIERARTRG